MERLLSRYQSEPDNALLCEQIGVMYTRLDALDKAAEFFQKAVHLNPKQISAQKNLATVLWFIGRKTESIAIFRSLEDRIPDDPVPHLYLGLAGYEGRNMALASREFEQAGALASQNGETFPVVVDAYLAAGQFAQAKEMLEHRVAANDADAKTYRLLGDAEDGLMLPEHASRAYSTAIEKAPGDERNYLALAGFAIEHGNAKYAREVLSSGLHVVPRSAKLRLELGLSWAIEGDFDRAKTAFADASSADLRSPLALLALGVTDLQTGKPDEAADCFRRATTIAPGDYRCYYLHAVALTRAHGNGELATRNTVVSELRHAIALAPDEAEPRVALAKAEIASGHSQIAEMQLREAVRIAPAQPGALYNLALLCRREGKTEEAARLLRSFQLLKKKSQDEENQFVLILKTVHWDEAAQ